MGTADNFLIACLGDSLTDGFPGHSSYGRSGLENASCYQYWVNHLVQEDFGLKLRDSGVKLEFINRGICGELTSQIGTRLYPEVVEYSQTTYKRNPDLVIIVAGTNDLGWGRDSYEISDNIIQMHTYCVNNNLKSLGATIPPTMFENEPNYNGSKTEVNSKIIEFFTKKKFLFADLYKDMSGPGDNKNLRRELDAGDGLHFSVEGYRAMGESIYRAGVREIIRGK